MKNPFAQRKKEKKDDEKKVLKAEEIEKSTEEIEAEKEQKKFEREERKFLKEHAKKRQKMERLIAPLLLILTIILSYLLLLTAK